MVTIEIDAASMAEMSEALDRLANHCRNIAPALKEIGEMLKRSTDERFDRQVAPDGTPWADIDGETMIAKRGTPGEGKILTHTTRLRRSINYQVVGDGLLVGTNVLYAAIHQLGGETGSRGRRFEMIARPFLGLSADDKERAIEIVADYLCESLSDSPLNRS